MSSASNDLISKLHTDNNRKVPSLWFVQGLLIKLQYLKLHVTNISNITGGIERCNQIHEHRSEEG